MLTFAIPLGDPVPCLLLYYCGNNLIILRIVVKLVWVYLLWKRSVYYLVYGLSQSLHLHFEEMRYWYHDTRGNKYLDRTGCANLERFESSSTPSIFKVYNILHYRWYHHDNTLYTNICFKHVRTGTLPADSIHEGHIGTLYMWECLWSIMMLIMIINLSCDPCHSNYSDRNHSRESTQLTFMPQKRWQSLFSCERRMSRNRLIHY